MEDFSLWIDAMRCQRETLSRLSIQPKLKQTHRPVILHDFIALKYLSINEPYLYTKNLTRAHNTTGDQAEPPNVETLELYWRIRGPMYDEESRNFYQGIIDIENEDCWPQLRRIITIYDGPLAPFRSGLGRYFLEGCHKGDTHPYIFEWPSSWFSPPWDASQQFSGAHGHLEVGF
jgi:hypothetical protein